MRQRDIVLVPFPFSDQSGSKVRPALIVSNDEFNSKSDDVVVCAVTSTIKPAKYSVIIGENDLEEGILHEQSCIKVETVLKIQKALILKTIATVRKTVFAKVTALISELVRQS